MIQAPRHLQGPVAGQAAEHRLADIQLVVVLVFVDLEVFAVRQIDVFGIELGRVRDQLAVLVDQRHLHQRIALHHPFFDRAGEIEMIRCFLEFVFDEAGDLVDLVNRLDRVLFQRSGENCGRGHRFTIRGFPLDRQTREDHGPKQDQHQHAERGNGEQGTAARHGWVAPGFGFARVGEAELAHWAARSLVPASCNCASIDCANFMGGCMVTKVPELLR